MCHILAVCEKCTMRIVISVSNVSLNRSPFSVFDVTQITINEWCDGIQEMNMMISIYQHREMCWGFNIRVFAWFDMTQWKYTYTFTIVIVDFVKLLNHRHSSSSMSQKTNSKRNTSSDRMKFFALMKWSIFLNKSEQKPLKYWYLFSSVCAIPVAWEMNCGNGYIDIQLLFTNSVVNKS